MNLYNICNKDDFDSDDLVTFQFDSQIINLYFSQLIKYSKHIRDFYLFSDANNRFPQELHKFQEEYQLPTESISYFFNLLRQDYNIKENTKLTYNQCVDLLKISKYLEVRKLSYQIDEYIKQHNIDVDFIIQMIQYEMSTQNENHLIEINSEIEKLLSNKIDECLSNEKFPDLPNSMIYRILRKSSPNSIKSDTPFDFIKKSISKFCVLFEFVDLQSLSDDRLDDLCEIYRKTDETSRFYFNYLKCNLSMISQMRGEKKSIQELLKSSNQSNEEQRTKMCELLEQLDRLKQEKDQLQIELNETQKDKKSIESEKNEIKKQLDDTVKERNDLKTQIELEKQSTIEGQIIASVKSGLIVSAKIELDAKGASIDSTRSKYMISTSSALKLGEEAYEKGEPITSLNLTTDDFICKSGVYYVRCIVYDVSGKSKELISNSVTTSGSSVLFGFEGKSSKVSLLEGKYKLEVWGAQEGDSKGERKKNSQPGKGGLGGYSQGIITLNEKETLYIRVGGEGKSASSSDGEVTNGGFPDGGGTKTGHWPRYSSVPGTGGGSTSIRIKNDTDYARVIVAGGGGGASGSYCKTDNGGFGGGLNGGKCYFCSSIRDQGHGTQTGSSCGLGRDSNGDAGIFGKGATGKYCSRADSGGGGGGGWYGGGSGGCGSKGGCGSAASSGGGGSGWVFTESSFNNWQSGDSVNASQFQLKRSFYLTNSSCVSGDMEFPKPDGNGNEQGHKGNGYAKITPQ